MAELVLRPRRTVVRLITKLIDELERGADIQLITQTSLGGDLQRLAAARMTATAVRPKTWPQPFPGTTLLHQQLTSIVKQEH